mgnify:CR=1 FL=1
MGIRDRTIQTQPKDATTSREKIDRKVIACIGPAVIRSAGGQNCVCTARATETTANWMKPAAVK